MTMSSDEAGETSRILIIDDDPHVIDAIRPYLTEAGYSVSEAGSGKSGLALFRDANPGLVLLDVRLPDLSGLDVCRQIRVNSKVPIIMLTSLGDPIDRVIGLELGADDYVAKPFFPREVISRIEAVLRRSSPSPHGMYEPNAKDAKSILRVGDLEVDVAGREARVGGKPVKLTPTEFNLLSVLAASPGQAFSRSELMGSSNALSSEETLDKHISNLRRKIEADPINPRYVITVYGFGYKIANGPSRD